MDKIKEYVTIKLRLYVVDNSRSAAKAVNDLKNFLEENFSGCYDLKVIDVLEEPHLAEKENILATPTVIKTAPDPEKRIIGDLSDGDKIRRGLSV